MSWHFTLKVAATKEREEAEEVPATGSDPCNNSADRRLLRAVCAEARAYVTHQRCQILPRLLND